MQRTKSRRLRPLLIALMLLCVLLIGSTQIVALSDWLRLRDYQPPATVSLLADQTTMTEVSRHLFYLNKPNLESKEKFAGDCPNSHEQTIILGCYIGGERGIFVLQVDDARLKGVEQVTVAHEMLHSAYERLDHKDKVKIDSLLQNYFDHSLKDERIRSTLEAYKISEPGQQLNEMHSIFGTEIATLPHELESYYNRYFTNRSKITDYAAQYQSAFTSRRAAIATDDTQLKAWKLQIDHSVAGLSAQNSVLKTQSGQLNTFRTAGNYEAYNNGVSTYNAQVDDYNAKIAAVKALTSQYNQLVQERNALVLEESQLQQALDASALSPISQ